jgi:hypothetical protein
MLAGRCSGRHSGAPSHPGSYVHIGFDGGIAARVEDLPGVHASDLRGHVDLLS